MCTKSSLIFHSLNYFNINCKKEEIPNVLNDFLISFNKCEDV